MALELENEVESYIRDNWEQVVVDIDALVRIPSAADVNAAAPGAPYGLGPARALDAALAIAARMGFETYNCDGHIGYADLPGAAETQIAIIGHVDVVPEGPGWTVPPYEVTRRDGYLMGRGVIDDKGPLVVALHAVDFWRQRLLAEGKCFPYTMRMIFGTSEEVGMGDIAYYRERFEDPAFLFTPDAEFPVGYGEAGICSGTLESTPIADGRLLRLEGGAAVNAVPGTAEAQLVYAGGALPQSEGIEAKVADGRASVRAQGRSAHASTPELGDNAIDRLAAYLLENGLLAEGERAFFDLVRKVTSCTDGSGVGVSASDEHFGDLTAVGSLISLREADDGVRLRHSIDFRYPTTTTSAEIARRMNEVAASIGATFTLDHDITPFLMDPDSPQVRALTDAYNQVTGEDAQPFTMKGGSYARMFSRAVSFGPEKRWEPKPVWAGGMHAANETISEDLLKQALEIYIRAIGNLMQIDF